MKFLIYTFDPNWRSGGIMVMHELSKILSDLGEDVYLTVTSEKLSENNSKLIDQTEAMIISAQDDCVTIYPEVVSGNPLNAKHVVRWVLYYPGEHGAGDTLYHESEYVFAYSKRFIENSIYENSPLLFIFYSNANKFYDIGTKRSHDAFLIRKGRLNISNLDERKNKHVNPYSNLLTKEIVNADYIIDNVSSLEQLNEAFNKIRYFISFDHDTYFNVLAALSGCISVIVPVDDIDSEQWKMKSEVSNYGISYGFDDLYWSYKTQNKIRDHILQMEQKNIDSAKNLIQLTKKKWNIS